MQIELPTETEVELAPAPAKKTRSIWHDFDQEVSELLKRTNPTSGGIVEVDKYLEPLLPRMQNPIKWWLSKKETYPRLFDIACRTMYTISVSGLCIPATSVPSKRFFSKAGQIIVDRRNRLSGKKVNQLLFLNHNL